MLNEPDNIHQFDNVHGSPYYEGPDDVMTTEIMIEKYGRNFEQHPHEFDCECSDCEEWVADMEAWKDQW